MKRNEQTKESKHRIQVFFEQRQVVKSKEIPSPSTIESDDLRACMEKLDQLVGLSNIKGFVHEIYAWLEIAKRRREAGLMAEQQVLHMVFTGNPGTGKTTVARLLAELLKEMGVLSKGHLVEVERADLVGEYIGHTAQKTREHIKRAIGGVLFLDEAYSLARGGEKDFGKEAIDTMVKSMEDFKDQFILILAGYEEEMNNFLRANPGLPSRFPIHLSFPDFRLDELMQIAEMMVTEREYKFSIPAKEKLRLHLQYAMEEDRVAFGNARYVRNLVEQAIRQQAVRLISRRSMSREDLILLRVEDFLLEESSPTVWYNQNTEKAIWNQWLS